MNKFLVQATLCCTKSFTVKSDEHSQWITDVCVSPRTLKIATSSGHRTVKAWDVDNVSKSCFHHMGLIHYTIYIIIMKCFDNT